MSLNKEMILNELGSVMNKLQSADCGCMGKMFSEGQPANLGQQAHQGGGGSMGFPLPTCGGCRRGCCHGHGYDSHNFNTQQYAGEPYSPTRPCMGMHCNPRTLYADTYNYLSSNLMKPAVREVYNDLKSINPNNTVMNNPMASQMGLKAQGGGAAMQAMNQNPGGDMGGMQDPNMSMNQQMTYPQMGQAQMSNAQMDHAQMGNAQMGGNTQMGNHPMGQMGGGMGETIMNMMTSEKGARRMPQTTGAMPNAIPQGQDSGGHYNPQMSNLTNGDQAQYVQQQNMSNLNAQNAMAYSQQNATGYTPQNVMAGNMQQNPAASYKVNYSNPAAQQMSANRPQANYGQHTGGMKMFNEMFPGVAGGDLGFDPMAIALQMNPANQQKSAMNTMQQLMDGKFNKTGAPGTNQPQNQQNISPSMQQPTPTQAAPTQQQIPQQQVYSATGAPTMNESQPQTYANVVPNQSYQQIPQQQLIPQRERQVYSVTGAPIMNQGQPQTDTNPVPNQTYQQIPQQQQISQQQQQLYTATGAPTMNQNQPQNYTNAPNQYYQQIPQQQQIPPQQQQGYAATGAPTLYQQSQSEQPYETELDANAAINQPPQDNSEPPTSTPIEERIMDPIFPADTSAYRRRINEKPRDSKYNTLGQPIKHIPAHLFHTEPDNRPQPLYPAIKTNTRFGVKNTVSKTSLMGTRPVGRVPSRSQLQNIYNQYKGSHSHTQQNIGSVVHNATHSDGKINVSANQPRQAQPMHLEGVGGDTTANNEAVPNPVKGQPTSPVGDVPADNKPHGDIVPAPNIPMKKCRNGLQDVVYTSYPTSAAWSFHGEPGGRRGPVFRGY